MFILIIKNSFYIAAISLALELSFMVCHIFPSILFLVFSSTKYSLQVKLFIDSFKTKWVSPCSDSIRQFSYASLVEVPHSFGINLWSSVILLFFWQLYWAKAKYHRVTHLRSRLHEIFIWSWHTSLWVLFGSTGKIGLSLGFFFQVASNFYYCLLWKLLSLYNADLKSARDFWYIHAHLAG